MSDVIRYRSPGGSWWALSAPGQVVYGSWVPNFGGQRPISRGLTYRRDSVGWSGNYLLLMNTQPGDRDISWEACGFAVYGRHEARGSVYLMLVAPFWSIALAAAALPLAWASSGLRSRARARRWKRRGLCTACGYDLRASPERCPECGTAASIPSSGTPGEG